MQDREIPMNPEKYADALNNALSEIKKAYPHIKNSFLFSKNGTIVTGDPEISKEDMEKIIESFEILQEKTENVGNLQSLQIKGKNGKLILSSINDMYLVLETSQQADKTHIYAITHAIIPTVLKTVENMAPMAPAPPPDTQDTPPPDTPKELVVDTLARFFVGNAVQVDTETLMEWTKNNEKNLKKVQIETLKGKTTRCSVKSISDVRRRGMNLIRIPEKLCRTLRVKKGDMVTVKPV
jgi:predicted regulator of Ras-like GTPase activity (Roadblock/LC7/MglB family)